VAPDEDGTHRETSVTVIVHGPVDLSLVNELARLRLMTKRHGVRLRIRADDCHDDLAALLAYLGLESLAEWSEPGGQAEAGE
jgi:hypothetical protein